MDTAQAASRLRSLASDAARRSRTAVLREVLPEIETAVRAGVSQVVILEELRTLGFEMTQSGFRSALRRLRTERPRLGRAGSSSMSTEFWSGLETRAGGVHRDDDPGFALRRRRAEQAAHGVAAHGSRRLASLSGWRAGAVVDGADPRSRSPVTSRARSCRAEAPRRTAPTAADRPASASRTRSAIDAATGTSGRPVDCASTCAMQARSR